ncbi:MAG: DUF3052 domain-containing protein [Acidobacteriota bacterium]
MMSPRPTSMTTYSSTPLVKKLGIKENARILLVEAPDDFLEELDPLPPGVSINRPPLRSLDLVLLFVKTRSQLAKSFSKLAGKLSPAGMLWVAWPKKASGVATDLSFDSVQKEGLSAGLVDTKICAINEIWSGLKFVIRLKDR